MKSPPLFALLLLCAAPAAPVWAQPDPLVRPVNGLPFPLVSPAEAEKLAALKPIKLQIKNVTVAWALEELQTQSGVELDLENVDYSKNTLAKRVSLDIETRSFNRAFDGIMERAGLNASLQRYSSDRPWRVNFNSNRSANEADGLQFGQELFAVRLSQLNTTLSKSLDLSDASLPSRTQRKNLNASITLINDPRLPLVGASRPRLTRAEDEQGRSLLTGEEDKPRYSSYSFYGSSRQDQTTLTLRPPEPDAKVLRHLEGVVVHSLVTATETWEVPDLLGAPQWTRTFKNGDLEEFVMTVKANPLKTTGSSSERVALSIEVTSNRRTVYEEIPSPLLASAPVIAALRIVDAKGSEMRLSGNSSALRRRRRQNDDIHHDLPGQQSLRQRRQNARNAAKDDF